MIRNVLAVEVNRGGSLTSRLTKVTSIVDYMKHKQSHMHSTCACNALLTVSAGLDANQAVHLYVNAGMKLPYKKNPELINYISNTWFT